MTVKTGRRSDWPHRPTDDPLPGDPLPGPLPGLGVIGGSTRFAGRRIGLLGGSFNPAHAGHRHISLMALRRLGLHQVWWLVSPQNPLKGTHDMAPLEARLASARNIAAHPAILPTTVESRLGTRRTLETLDALQRACPTTRFVWLMGADNLVGFHRWHQWSRILHSLPIAVIDRPSYSVRALASPAAVKFATARVPEAKARTLADRTAPAWTFLTGPRHPESASRIRAGRRATGIDQHHRPA